MKAYFFVAKLPLFCATLASLSSVQCGKQKDKESSETQSFQTYSVLNIPQRTGTLGQTLPKELRLLDQNNETKAIFTEGSFTVLFYGAERTLSEPNVENTVTTKAWIRILPAPFNGEIPTEWFQNAVNANNSQQPDIFGLGMQYIQGASDIQNSAQQTIAGDASYGPFDASGTTRVGGSDIMDFIGSKIVGVLSNGRSNPKAENAKSLDCSGFIRMIYAYRASVTLNGTGINIPLAKQTPAEPNTMPRTAAEIMAGQIGHMIVPDKNIQITTFTDFQPGDLAFFRAEQESDRDIDHVAVYLGLDDEKNHRFLSSRKTADGPTLGDIGGASLLNGPGIYSKSFHAVKRL